MGTNCAPLLADIILYSYEADFVVYLPTKLLTHIKQGLQKHCETALSIGWINQMWILMNSKELLEHLKSSTINHVTSIKSFWFFNSLYIHSSPENKRQTHQYYPKRFQFKKKNANHWYKYLVLGHKETYFYRSTLILKTSTLKLTSSRCLSF